MSDRMSDDDADSRHDPMLGAPLKNPRWLRTNMAFLPVVLGLGFALVIYFPTFSRGLLVLALFIVAPLAMWSWALGLWATRRRLEGDPVIDRRTLLETTGAALTLQSVGAPVLGLVFALIGARFSEAPGLLDSSGPAYVVAAYLVILGTSYLLLGDWMVELELDRLSRRPVTRLGRLLRPGMPSFTAMAICGLVLSAVLVRVGGAELFVGVCALLAALYMVQVSVVNLERWRRFRRFMRSEGEQPGEHPPES